MRGPRAGLSIELLRLTPLDGLDAGEGLAGKSHHQRPAPARPPAYFSMSSARFSALEKGDRQIDMRNHFDGVLALLCNDGGLTRDKLKHVLRMAWLQANCRF